ncbi:hypothetical protein [Streptomyces cyaneofuscatus]|uniref:hypothetical protein n=1 Tax=Streptomyces cyaneofuscatus TaxID=66883 RepID=UPI0036DC01B6
MDDQGIVLLKEAGAHGRRQTVSGAISGRAVPLARVPCFAGPGGVAGLGEERPVDAGNATALGVAVVGVLGTLLSALLTQRAGERSRKREYERAEAAQERRAETQEALACYVAFNTAVRQYLAALTDQVHELGQDGPDSVQQRLTEARDHHRDAYAEVQLRAPERITGLAGDLSRELGVVYGMVRRIVSGAPRESDSVAAARERIDALWRQLRDVRREMRINSNAPQTP